VTDDAFPTRVVADIDEIRQSRKLIFDRRVNDSDEVRHRDCGLLEGELRIRKVLRRNHVTSALRIKAVSRTVNRVEIARGLASRTERHDLLFDARHDGSGLLRNEGRHKTIKIESVLLHLVRNERSRLLVLVDRELEVTSIEGLVLDCLTLNVVA